jgi:flavin-dependent dehydrogenase
MKADVAIVGAGTAGAALALCCARKGLSVVCVDRRPLSEAGAHWINDVAGWMFDEAGIDRPAEGELAGEGHAFHVVAGFAGEHVVVEDHGLLAVDMRRLVERLQRGALDKGARLLGETTVEGFDGQTLSTSAGPISARFYVDASGLSGARLLAQPPVAQRDICVAAQQLRRVRDPEAARDFFLTRGAKPGETLCFTSIAGGYSVVNVRLQGDDLAILTGSIPAEGHPAGKELLERFVAEHAFIGDTIRAGARAIPLRRPYDLLGKGNVALLGDAACQVFSAHGSGIGLGMIAARMLAEAIAGGQDGYAYAVAFHRQWGGLLATYELFRRFSQSLTVAELDAMMRAGLMDEAAVRGGLQQRVPALTAPLVLGKLAALARAPGLRMRLVRALAAGAGAHALYRRCPAREERFPVWQRRLSSLSAIGTPSR